MKAALKDRERLLEIDKSKNNTIMVLREEISQLKLLLGKRVEIPVTEGTMRNWKQ